MTEPPHLGVRAAILLGLLAGHTKTVDELHALVALAADHGWVDDLGPEWGHPAISLRAMADAGPPLVRELLGRLERLGFAEHVELDGSELWMAKGVPS